MVQIIKCSRDLLDNRYNQPSWLRSSAYLFLQTHPVYKSGGNVVWLTGKVTLYIFHNMRMLSIFSDLAQHRCFIRGIMPHRTILTAAEQLNCHLTACLFIIRTVHFTKQIHPYGVNVTVSPWQAHTYLHSHHSCVVLYAQMDVHILSHFNQ